MCGTYSKWHGLGKTVAVQCHFPAPKKLDNLHNSCKFCWMKYGRDAFDVTQLALAVPHIQCYVGMSALLKNFGEWSPKTKFPKFAPPLQFLKSSS